MEPLCGNGGRQWLGLGLVMYEYDSYKAREDEVEVSSHDAEVGQGPARLCFICLTYSLNLKTTVFIYQLIHSHQPK